MRTTVYIPDDLGEALERHKAAINVSALLQEGLQREIGRLELAGELDAPDTDVIERLRSEKEAWEDKWFKVGVRLGDEWARQARYEGLKSAAEYWEENRHRKPPRLPTSDPVAKILVEAFGMDGPRLDAEELLGSGITKRYPALADVWPIDEEYALPYWASYDKQAMSRGWAEAVLEFWESVKGELG